MAASIQRALGLQAELVQGSGGIFDVKVNGKVIYSKHETGRFPDDEEIVGALRHVTA